MKTTTVSALVLFCLTGHGLTAPTTFSGPPDVVRRSASWVVAGRHVSSLDQAQIEQIGNDISESCSLFLVSVSLVCSCTAHVRASSADMVTFRG